MAEWYKLYISPWNDGTSDLTLEQEAAYLRIVNAIRMTELPIRYDFFVLGGLWRCNERKAKRLLAELIDAGKLSVEGRTIINRRAVDDASNLSRTRVERQSAGSRGGVESGKSRSKSLEINNVNESLLEPDKTRLDKTKQEKKDPQTPKGDFDEFWSACPRKIGKGAAQKAYAKAVKIVDPKVIADAMATFAKSQAGKDPQYIPHPSTWLNAGRWDDDVDAVQAKRSFADPQDGDILKAPDGRWKEYVSGVGWCALDPDRLKDEGLKND